MSVAIGARRRALMAQRKWCFAQMSDLLRKHSLVRSLMSAVESERYEKYVKSKG